MHHVLYTINTIGYQKEIISIFDNDEALLGILLMHVTTRVLQIDVNVLPPTTWAWGGTRTAAWGCIWHRRAALNFTWAWRWWHSMPSIGWHVTSFWSSSKSLRYDFSSLGQAGERIVLEVSATSAEPSGLVATSGAVVSQSTMTSFSRSWVSSFGPNMLYNW